MKRLDILETARTISMSETSPFRPTPQQYGSTAARQHGSTAARQHSSTAAQQHGSTAARQHGSTAARQHGSTAAQQHSSTTTLHPKNVHSSAKRRSNPMQDPEPF
jgi:hypothetical protein